MTQAARLLRISRDTLRYRLERLQDRIGVNTGWIVYHESMRDTARVRVVVDALVEFFERNHALFSGIAG